MALDDLLSDVQSAAEKGAGYASGLADTFGEVKGYVDEVKEAGAAWGLWPSPTGAAGRWGFVSIASFPNRPARAGYEYTAPSGARYGWRFLGLEDVYKMKKVREIPEWVPIYDAGPAWEWSSLLWRLWKAGLVFEDLAKVDGFDPAIGVADPGTSFDAMSTAQQRAYLANAYVIAAVKNRNNPDGALQAAAALDEQQKSLGWCKFANEAGCKSERELGGYMIAADGRPLQILTQDKTAAIARIVAGAHGMPTPPIPDTTTGATGAGAAAASTFEAACLTEATPREQRLTCLEGYRSDPTAAAALASYPDPWKPIADPTKALQMVRGVDLNRYVVLGVGLEQSAIRAEIAVSLGAIIVVTTGALAYGLVRYFVGK